MGRSTFITHANGIMPIDVVMQATGHRDPKIVLRRYNQATVARQVDVAKRAWGEEDE
jgi:integrase